MFFHLYGLFIGIGILLGLKLASKAQARLAIGKNSYLELNLDDILIWLLIPGIIGARLYHVIDYWTYYSQVPIEALKIWQGGLGIYGGIAGGLLGLIVYSIKKHSKLPLFAMLDVIAFGLPLAQAIGRIGNFINQELFGLPTNLPWGIWIDPNKRPIGFENYERFHPLFAYEALGNLLLLSLMWGLLRKKRKSGFYFGIYLLGYGLIRFGLDFLRIEPWRMGILTTAQWVSLIFIFIGVCMIWFRKKIANLIRSQKIATPAGGQ